MPSPTPNSSAALANTSPSATRSKIIGGVLGTLGGALVIGLACYAYLRWRRKSCHILPITEHGPGSDQPGHGIARLGHHRRSYSFNPNLLIRKIINKPVTSRRCATPVIALRLFRLSSSTHRITVHRFLRASLPKITAGCSLSNSGADKHMKKRHPLSRQDSLICQRSFLVIMKMQPIPTAPGLHRDRGPHAASLS